MHIEFHGRTLYSCLGSAAGESSIYAPPLSVDGTVQADVLCCIFELVIVNDGCLLM